MSIPELQKYYKTFLNCCCDNGLNFFKTKNPQDLISWICDGEKPSHIFGDFGMTKAVLYDAAIPYVIKIPLVNGGNSINYCEKEYQNFLKAKEIPEIVNCFAWCCYLFDYCGIPIYVMEKVDCNTRKISSYAFDAAFEYFRAKEGATEDSDEYKLLLDQFTEEFFSWDDSAKNEILLENQWTERVYELFGDFCWENDINDLHTGNFGFKGNTLVVIDYSGFHF